MIDDGQVQYANYTLAELKEALDRIDRVRYPRNYANLALELAIRDELRAIGEPGAMEPAASPPPSPSPLIPEHVANWIYRLGWILMALGTVLAFGSIDSDYDQLPNHQRIALLLPMTGGWLMVNIHTLRDMRSADIRNAGWAIGSVLAFALMFMGWLMWLIFDPGARG